MALCIGDIHGNFEKAKAFLEYKPEVEHIFVGDYTDSFSASDEEIIKTMKMIFNSNAIILAGNHDNQYFKTAGRFTKCTGYRTNYNFVHMMESYKDKIIASYVVDDFIITHAGITKAIGRNFDNIIDLNDWINEEFERFKNAVVQTESYSPIFNIGSCRGGWDTYGGVFWADYRCEKYDYRFNQVFGHSHRSFPNIWNVGKKNQQTFVLIDCPQFFCFNTETYSFEDFFPKNLEVPRSMLERLF